MRAIVAILLVPLLAYGEEKSAEVKNFDADRESIKMMITKVEGIVSESSDVGTIKFPDGSFTLHPELHDGPPGPPKEGRSLTTKATNIEAIRKWLVDTKIEGVQIWIDTDLPSSRLFAIEKVLTERKVRYWMSVTDGPDGEVSLQETDRPLPSPVP